MNRIIENHLQAGHMELCSATDAEVLGLCAKALQALLDARNSDLSLHGRVLRAYAAGRTTALAIDRCAGYRVRASERLDHVAFDTAQGVVAEPNLRRALDEMNALRTVRDAIQYEADDDLGESTLRNALRTAEQIVTLGAEYLRNQRPHLSLAMPG